MTAKNTLIFGGAIAAILWLFLSGGDSSESNDVEPTSEIITSRDEGSINGSIRAEPVTSVVEPIKVIEISDNVELGSQTNKEGRTQAQAQFNQATELVKDQQWQKAEAIYLDLIDRLPTVIGPYINLSAVYAQTNRMDDARTILLKGLKANQNYAVLFDNLQSIHGALAAQAYSAALITDETKSTAQNSPAQLDLPMIDSIDHRLIDTSQQQELVAQLRQLQNAQQSQADSTSRIAQLERELATVNEALSGDAVNTSNTIAGLESQLQELEIELVTRTEDLASAEKELIDLKQSATQVVAIQNQSNPTSSQVAVVSSASTLKGTTISNTTAESESSSDLADQQEINIVSNLVKNWAESWSQQDVNGYISHYINGYSPPQSQLTHRQWADQRQVRLTNKKYINVDVADFEFEELVNNQFSVSFTQRYRSNTIDDTVRKKLIFAKSDVALSQSKIVDEIIVTD